MSDTLYSRDVLRLATALPPYVPLVVPDGAAKKRSPICGSEIHIEIALDGERRVNAIAIRARACALGQAAAAILHDKVAGMNLVDAEGVASVVRDALAGEGTMGALWPELAPLDAARDYPARHAAIRLPFEALVAALQDAI